MEGNKKLVEFDKIVCTRCLKKRKEKPGHRCFATRPFTACTSCSDHNGGCDFKEKQQAFVNQHVIGASKTLQSIGKKIRQRWQGKKGLALSVDMMAVSLTSFLYSKWLSDLPNSGEFVDSHRL